MQGVAGPGERFNYFFGEIRGKGNSLYFPVALGHQAHDGDRSRSRRVAPRRRHPPGREDPPAAHPRRARVAPRGARRRLSRRGLRLEREHRRPARPPRGAVPPRRGGRRREDSSRPTPPGVSPRARGGRAPGCRRVRAPPRPRDLVREPPRRRPRRRSRRSSPTRTWTGARSRARSSSACGAATSGASATHVAHRRRVRRTGRRNRGPGDDAGRAGRYDLLLALSLGHSRPPSRRTPNRGRSSCGSGAGCRRCATDSRRAPSRSSRSETPSSCCAFERSRRLRLPRPQRPRPTR